MQTKNYELESINDPKEREHHHWVLCHGIRRVR